MLANFYGFLFRILLPALAITIFLMNYNKFKKIDSTQILYIYKFISILLILLLCTSVVLPQSLVVVDRLSLYLYPITIYVFTRLPLIKLFNLSSYSWRFIITVLISSYTIFWLFFASHSPWFVPYKSFLF